jgi:acyl carrier protein
VISDEAICKIVASVLPATATRGGVTPDMDLRADLGLDSVGLMSVVFLLDEEVDFDVFAHVQRFIEAQTVSDVIEVVRQ